MADQISASGQQPTFQVTVQDLVNRFSSVASGATPGRTSALITASGAVLIAKVTQAADPNPLQIARVTNPAIPSQWTTYATIASSAYASAGCALAQSGSTIRLFYQTNTGGHDRTIAYRDSTDDGVTWGAEQYCPAPPLGTGNFCYGIAADSTTTVLAAYASFDPNGACSIYKSSFSVAWSAWATVGPTSPAGWGLIRGLQMIAVAGTRYLAAGCNLKMGLTGISAATTTSTDLLAFTPWNPVQQLDNPDLGLTCAWSSVHASAGTFYLAVTLTDTGSVSGTPHSRTTIYSSIDFASWSPYASLGQAFQYGAHLLILNGLTYMFDGAQVYSAPVGPAAVDVSDDVLSLAIEERVGEPSRATIRIANLGGTYSNHPSIRADATIKVWLGYGTSLVQTHSLIVDSYTYQATAERNELILQARDVAKLLDYPSTRLLAYTGKTLGQLIATVCQLAAVPLATLPGTSQFSQTVPCFVITPGETWLTALTRLGTVYGFDAFADATPQLRIYEPNAADASTWSYGSEVFGVSASYNADQANVIRVSGVSGTSTVFAEAIDGANLVSVSRERYRQIVDRMLDSAARCQLRANLALRDEQARAFVAQIIAAINPAHELDDVITFSEPDFALVDQRARIVTLQLTIDLSSGTWMHRLECTGV